MNLDCLLPRIHDFKHHYVDVVGGFIAGGLLAALVFARTALSLSELTCTLKAPGKASEVNAAPDSDATQSAVLTERLIL